MVDGIRSSSEFARAAIDAARRNHERLAQQLSEGLAGSAQPGGSPLPAPVEADAAQAPRFDDALGSGLERVDQAVRTVDQLPGDLVAGDVTDLHEVALRLKESELTYRFALEVRNKLIDAYREVMRMSV